MHSVRSLIRDFTWSTTFRGTEGVFITPRLWNYVNSKLTNTIKIADRPNYFSRQMLNDPNI